MRRYESINITLMGSGAPRLSYIAAMEHSTMPTRIPVDHARELLRV
jgi:hypothetical protein